MSRLLYICWRVWKRPDTFSGLEIIYCKSDRLSSGSSFLALESFIYITIQIIAKKVSTIGCAAITPSNCHKVFRIVAAGINSIIFLIIVISKDFTAAPETFCKGLFNQIHRKFTFQGKKIEPGTCFLDSWLISALYIFWSVFSFLTSSTERPTNSAIFSSVIVPSSSIFFATFIIPSFNV